MLENRPAAFSETDRALAEQGRAAYVVTKLGVPLVWIFPYRGIRAWPPRSVRLAGP